MLVGLQKLADSRSLILSVGFHVWFILLIPTLSISVIVLESCKLMNNEDHPHLIYEVITFSPSAHIQHVDVQNTCMSLLVLDSNGACVSNLD